MMGIAPLNVHVPEEKFHGLEGQNAHDQIMGGRRFKLAFMIRLPYLHSISILRGYPKKKNRVTHTFRFSLRSEGIKNIL